jgi:hypothetical protein
MRDRFLGFMRAGKQRVNTITNFPHFSVNEKGKIAIIIHSSQYNLLFLHKTLQTVLLLRTKSSVFPVEAKKSKREMEAYDHSFEPSHSLEVSGKPHAPSLYPCGYVPSSMEQEAGWNPQPFWAFKRSLLAAGYEGYRLTQTCSTFCVVGATYKNVVCIRGK